MRILLAAISRIVGWLSRLEQPQRGVAIALRVFVRIFRPNLDEASKQLAEYGSVHDFFIRELRPGVRVIGEGLVSPVDGKLLAVTPVTDGCALNIKGLVYTVNDLLGSLAPQGDPTRGDTTTSDKHLAGYSAWHFYLSPRDYHRVHFPCAGEVTAVAVIPGTLWPVGPWCLRLVPQLYTRNERVVFAINTAQGDVLYLVLIGALNVGNITIAFDADVNTNTGALISPSARKLSYVPPEVIAKGDLAGVFHLGSSVVLVAPDSSLSEGVASVIERIKGRLVNVGVQMGRSLDGIIRESAESPAAHHD